MYLLNNYLYNVKGTQVFQDMIYDLPCKKHFFPNFYKDLDIYFDVENFGYKELLVANFSKKQEMINRSCFEIYRILMTNLKIKPNVITPKYIHKSLSNSHIKTIVDATGVIIGCFAFCKNGNIIKDFVFGEFELDYSEVKDSITEEGRCLLLGKAVVSGNLSFIDDVYIIEKFKETYKNKEEKTIILKTNKHD